MMLCSLRQFSGIGFVDVKHDLPSTNDNHSYSWKPYLYIKESPLKITGTDHHNSKYGAPYISHS